jgi:hypothetical protein
MPNRRDFFKAATAAAASAYAVGRGMPALAQRGGGGGQRGRGAGPTGPVVRKQVMVGGRRVRVIDVHSHCTVDGVADVVKGTKWAMQGGGRSLAQDRIDLIDSEGIDIQVLTING